MKNEKTKSNLSNFLITMPMGLDGVAAAELAEKLSGVKPSTRSSQEIGLQYPATAGADLLHLRSVTDVWLIVHKYEGIGSHYADLRHLEELLARTNFSATIDILRQAGFQPKRNMDYFATCSLRGERSYRRLDALQTLERGLNASSKGFLRPVREHAALRFWLHLSDDTARLCLALSASPVGLRNRAASLPASLPGPVAYAMAALCKPTANDIFLDPMCGSGSISLERAENWRHGQLLIGDIAPQAIETTRQNFGPKHRPRQIFHWDAGQLPLAEASVDAIACNPPYGIQIQPEEGVERLYRRFIGEAGRVLRPGKIMTFLTPSRELTDKILNNEHCWRIEHCFVIDLLGQRPYLYTLRRI